MNRVYELIFLSATECDAYCRTDSHFSVSRDAQLNAYSEMSEQFHTDPWCKCGNEISLSACGTHVMIFYRTLMRLKTKYSSLHHFISFESLYYLLLHS